ncbi:unnamed protein product [Cylicocyclus nassatus]|uniref:Reverse transcriptase domain-containing protein n=1 Tax=Cylicocyclus nassatus TaxID=53992 RepID=A0AA36GKI5_CYLNA|nr:unnamed protein product [Cylicocyclus nassatus]
MSEPYQNDQHGPDPAVIPENSTPYVSDDIVQLRREDFDNIIAQIPTTTSTHSVSQPLMAQSTPLLFQASTRFKECSSQDSKDPSRIHLCRSKDVAQSKCVLIAEDSAIIEVNVQSRRRENQEIDRLLLSRSIVQVPKSEWGSTRINPISVAEGKKLRLILDLSSFNKSLKKVRVKYEDVARVLPLLPERGFMASFDLQAGYHHVKINDNFTHFLGFRWKNKIYKFLVLPFGLSPAPYIFTKLMRPLLKKWRATGLFVAIYLDDGLIWAKSAHECELAVAKIRDDLSRAGFFVAEDKCSWRPLQKMTWLGHVIDLEGYTLDITPARKEKASALATRLLNLRGVSLHERLKWQGTIASMHLVIPPGHKKRWKAVVAAIAEKQSKSTSLSYRWALSSKESAKLKGGVPNKPFVLTPSLLRPGVCGVPVSYDFLLDHRRRNASVTALVASQRGLDSVAAIIDSCIDNSVAPGTLNIYKRVKKNFLNFISNFNVPLAALSKLRNVFVAHLIDKGKSRSLGYHIAALSQFFGPMAGDDLEVQKALVRMAARRGPPTRYRTKATLEDVTHMIEWALKTQSKTALRAATMILLAFSAFLRLGEICSLRFSDLSYQGDALWWLLIRKSKTDQKGEGSTVAFHWDSIAQDLWDHYCDAYPPTSPSNHIFSCRGGSAMSKDYAARQIRKALGEAGLGAKKLTAHSFRGGAATNALNKGSDSHKIMLAGRWKTFTSFKAYIDPVAV